MRGHSIFLVVRPRQTCRHSSWRVVRDLQYLHLSEEFLLGPSFDAPVEDASLEIVRTVL